jgi:hypothetical protein
MFFVFETKTQETSQLSVLDLRHALMWRLAWWFIFPVWLAGLF